MKAAGGTAAMILVGCPGRKGLRIIILVTIVTSFMLVYNSCGDWLSSAASHQTAEPVVSEKHSSEASTLEGYFSVADHKPLKMHCRSCSLVSSSGQLIGKQRGGEIDRSDCVIRMNDAPTVGYQRDVGRRTSLRVVAHSSLQRVQQNRQELLDASREAVYIFWGPSSSMRRDGKGHVYSSLRQLNQMLPRLQLYYISQTKMLTFGELFEKETGIDRKSSNTWLSTGWFTMVILLELCDRVDVFGMVPPEFCRFESHPSVPYHYYEPRGPDECSMYLFHENSQQGGHHRFIAEKAVFANWARTLNISFHQPDWKPTAAISGSNSSHTLFQRGP